MRLKVTYKLKYPYVSLCEFSCYDSILASKVAELLGENGIDEINRNVPIRKINYEDGMYFHAASIPIFSAKYVDEHVYTQNTSITRFSKTLPYDEVVRIKNIVEQCRGPWKSKLFKVKCFYAEQISFIADVPTELVDEFEFLAETVKALGKKRNWGYGMVSAVDIQETDEKIIRPVPVGVGIPCNEPYSYLTVLPPYWSARRYLCGMAAL